MHLGNNTSICERFPSTKKFQKFRSGCKWNTTFWFFPLEIFRNKRNSWKGSPVFPVETSQWKICVPFTDLLSLSPVPCLSRSIKRPGLPRMGLVTNGTRFSQTEIPNRKVPIFFCKWKTPCVTGIRMRSISRPREDQSAVYLSTSLPGFLSLSPPPRAREERTICLSSVWVSTIPACGGGRERERERERETLGKRKEESRK